MSFGSALRKSGLLGGRRLSDPVDNVSPSQALGGINVTNARPRYDYAWDATKAIVEGYKANAWVFACMSRIAGAASSVPWRTFILNSSGDWVPSEGHDYEQLIEYPNNKLTRKRLMYYQACWLLATGNCIFRKVRVNDSEGSVREIWPMAPRAIAPIPSKEEWVLGYEFREENQTTVILADDVIHAMFPDPDDVLWGCGPLQSVWETVRADTVGGRWRADMFDRGGVPPGAIVDSSIQTNEQLMRGKERLRASWGDAASNAVPMLLTGDAKWMNLSVTADDLQYMSGRQFSVHEIVSAFDLMPAMFDPVAATYDNVESAIRWMWDRPVVNILDTLEDAFNLALLSREERANTWIHYDLSAVKALREDMARKVAGVATALAVGVAPDDAYQLFDLPVEGSVDGKTRFISAGLVPLAQAAAGADGAALGGPMPPMKAPTDLAALLAGMGGPSPDGPMPPLIEPGVDEEVDLVPPVEDLTFPRIAVKKALDELRERRSQAVQKYSPDQRRDYHGRFSAEGGGDAPASGESYADILAQPSSVYKALHPEEKDTKDQFSTDGEYAPERQKLHDAIVAKFLQGKTGVENPLAIILGGGQASGKSTLTDSKGFMLGNVVTINVDLIRDLLPETIEDKAANGGKAPSVSNFHEEASDIARELLKAASSQSMAVVMDGTGNSTMSSLSAKIDILKAAGYTVEANYVNVPLDTAIAWSKSRAQNTDRREVPLTALKRVHGSVSRIFPAAVRSGLFDRANLWNTNVPLGSEPILIMSAVDGKITIYDPQAWDDFLKKGEAL